MRYVISILTVLAITMGPAAQANYDASAARPDKSNVVYEETTGSNLPLLGVIGVTLVGALVVICLFLTQNKDSSDPDNQPAQSGGPLKADQDSRPTPQKGDKVDHGQANPGK